MTSKDKSRQRRHSLKQGLWLEAFTITWNIPEGVIAVSVGLFSNSVALIGFGIDSGH